MLGDLEAAVADSLRRFGAASHPFKPAVGALCANCDAPLQGQYCYSCGQDADTHKRSIGHLAWEGVEGLLHLDGRLRRTLPDLFFHPGRLTRDYMENRIARHVPPFRTFLVALLLFVFAAEHAMHKLQIDSANRSSATQTPAGRAKEAADIRRAAASERASDLVEAARDRAGDLKDGDPPAAVEATYLRENARAAAKYAGELARGDRVASGVAAPDISVVSKPDGRGSWFELGLHKAIANPEYYLNVLFTWAHRVAFLLLPIVGLALALVYSRRRDIFFYDHLLVAMNLLSFCFLTYALGLILPPPAMGWWLLFVTLWTPVNLFQTLRGAYGSSIPGAILKTLFVWTATVFAFSALLTGLVMFALTQL